MLLFLILGLSSIQLDDLERGFSFKSNKKSRHDNGSK